MRSITGFLNSYEGKGLLVLGIKGKGRAEELACVPRRLLGKNKDVAESRLRNWIFSYLGSIPPAISPPRLFVKVFDCKECGLADDGWIALVYIERTYDALYYSKVDEVAYLRRGDETRKLGLEEVISTIDAKRQPMVLILMEPKRVGTDKVSLDINMYNIGSRIANIVASLIVMGKRATLGKIMPQAPLPIILNSVDIVYNVITTADIKKKSESDKEAILQVSSASPISLPVFPWIANREGGMELAFERELPRNLSLVIRFLAKTYTELNYTVQECFVLLDLNTARSYQVCTNILVEDFMRKTVLAITSKEGEYLVYDREKGIRVERLKQHNKKSTPHYL